MKISTTILNQNEVTISPQLIGLSGFKNNNPRKQVNDLGELVLIKDGSYTIYIYFNQALKNYHKPQDAIGVSLQEKSIRFVLADGVSIVENQKDNESGIFSKQLMEKTLEYQFQDWPYAINEESKFIFNKQYNAASTFIGGEIKNNDKKILSLSFISNINDTGLTYFYSDKELYNIRNESNGFLPRNFTPYIQKIELPDKYSLILSTDGVFINSENLVNLLEMNKNEMSAEMIRREICSIIQENKDDQSLLIITKD